MFDESYTPLCPHRVFLVVFFLLLQELICLRAILDVNVPKFLQDDLKLFNGIVSDLFPKTKQEPINYGALEESMRNICANKNLKDVDGESKSCCFANQPLANVSNGLAEP